MMGTSSINTKDKLKDILETQRMLVALIQQYTFKLDHNDEILSDYDARLSALTKERTKATLDFNSAPQRLVELKSQLAELRTKYTNLKGESSGKTQRVAKFKALKLKLDLLKQELEAEGIDPESGLKIDIPSE